MKTITAISILILVLPFSSRSQSVKRTIDETISIGLQNNYQLKSSALLINQNKVLQKTAYDFDKTNLIFSQDPTGGGNIDNSIGITQSVSLPSVYKSKANALRQQTILSERSLDVVKFELVRDIKLAFYDLVYDFEKIKLLNFQDSIYRNFNDRAQVRYKTGETSKLELLTAQTKSKEIQLQKRQTETDIKLQQLALQKLLNTNEIIEPSDTSFYNLGKSVVIDSTGLSNHPLFAYYNQKAVLAKAETNAEKKKLLPEFNAGYFHQVVIRGFDPAKINRDYSPGTRIAGFQVGVAVPLFARSQRAKIEASKMQSQIVQAEAELSSLNLQNSYSELVNEYLKLQQAMDYYTSGANEQAKEILRISQFSFKMGEIGYVEHMQNLTQAISIQLNYLETIHDYNEVIIKLNSIKGK